MKVLLALFALIISTLPAAEMGPGKVNPSDIRIIPVQATPEADNIQSFITFPADYQVVNNPVNVQLRLSGYPLGTMSDFERKNDLLNDRFGQSMRIFIDNLPYFSIYQSYIDDLDDNTLYYDRILNTTVPYNLRQGMHVIRIVPVRSYGECLKGRNVFAASIFYIGEQKNNLNVDLQRPYLTYNEPSGNVVYPRNKPILLDFYISNVQLSRDGYKVRITIDDKTRRLLVGWYPFYIYGLRSGRHKIRLQLLDEKNEVVPGMFNDVEKTIHID